jgi:hypothetical protein
MSVGPLSETAGRRYGRLIVRDGANAGRINYMLKGRQKPGYDGFLDIESMHNPIADA